jgi:hypothetical protein
MCAVATNHITMKHRRPERGRMSQEDVASLAETAAHQLLGVSSQEAFAMLDRGELEGTFAGTTMQSLRFLLDA